MWLRKSMSRTGIKGYHILITGDKNILVGDALKKIKSFSELKLLNKTAYNNLILTQEDTFYFRIDEELETKANKYRNTRQAWINISRKFEPTTRASKITLRKKFSKLKPDGVTRNPK